MDNDTYKSISSTLSIMEEQVAALLIPKVLSGFPYLETMATWDVLAESPLNILLEPHVKSLQALEEQVAYASAVFNSPAVSAINDILARAESIQETTNVWNPVIFSSIVPTPPSSNNVIIKNKPLVISINID